MGMRIIKSAMMLTIVALAVQFVVAPPSSGQSADPITEGAKVTIAFTITVPETRVVVPNNVSEYVPGQRQLIPALEQALNGMKEGDQKRVDLEAEEAFGQYDERKRVTVSREELPRGAQMGSIQRTPDGTPFTIVSLSDNSAVIDFNHPLAGKHLVFDVRVLKVERGS